MERALFEAVFHCNADCCTMQWPQLTRRADSRLDLSRDQIKTLAGMPCCICPGMPLFTLSKKCTKTELRRNKAARHRQSYFRSHYSCFAWHQRLNKVCLGKAWLSNTIIPSQACVGMRLLFIYTICFGPASGCQTSNSTGFFTSASKQSGQCSE